MFHTKYREKCIYFVLTEHTIVMNIWRKKRYIFSGSLQSKDSTGTVPKPNDTGCANYTGWNMKMIMHLVNLNMPLDFTFVFHQKHYTLTCSLIITMESKKDSTLKEHYWGLPNQEKIICPTFGGENTGW